MLRVKEIHFYDINVQSRKKAQRVASKSLFSHASLQHCQFSWVLQNNFYSTHTFFLVLYYDLWSGWISARVTPGIFLPLHTGYEDKLISSEGGKWGKEPKTQNVQVNSCTNTNTCSYNHLKVFKAATLGHHVDNLESPSVQGLFTLFSEILAMAN